MESKRRCFIGGNWKSNNTINQTDSLVTDVLKKLEFDHEKVEVVVAPISLHLLHTQQLLKDTKVEVAAQNCSQYAFGAYTG